MIEARFTLARPAPAAPRAGAAAVAGPAAAAAAGAATGVEGRFTLEVDLALPSHGISALYGPSGCGKTTLLRCLAGLEPLVRGRLVVEGETWQDERVFVPPHRRAVGLVFQEASLFEHLDVRGNLAFGWRRIAAGERRIALEQAIELLDIAALLPRRAASLSGGERQRVAIARALAVSPRLLLLDEPLAAVDAARKAEILPWLHRLQRTLTIPIVLVSHSIDEIARLADHLVLMREGRCTASGALAELLARPDLPLPQGEDAGVVLHARVAERDDTWHLARLQGCEGSEGVSLWTRDAGLAPGEPVRVRVLARDVGLATAPQHDTSITNQLAGTVEAIAEDSHPALALVRLRVGRAALLARLTRRSVHALGLAPGREVWAQVKSVALLE